MKRVQMIRSFVQTSACINYFRLSRWIKKNRLNSKRSVCTLKGKTIKYARKYTCKHIIMNRAAIVNEDTRFEYTGRGGRVYLKRRRVRAFPKFYSCNWWKRNRLLTRGWRVGAKIHSQWVMGKGFTRNGPLVSICNVIQDADRSGGRVL